MGEKAAGALFALLFAVCFGGVGIFAGTAMGTALWEGIAAQDWVRVRAQVSKYDASGVHYRYRVGEREFSGDKIGVGWLQNSEVEEEVDARLTEAARNEKPVTVFVNPDDPSKSVVDPQIPWTMIAFLTPFAFGFGGVGLGATYMVFHILLGPDEKKKRAPVPGGVHVPIKTSAGGEVGFLWIFTFFWNVIAFPIALVAVPDLIRNEEWLGLLVLVFPAIGLLLLWGAIAATIRAIRRGPAKLVLATAEPRMGLPLSGHVQFARGVKAGDHFRAKLGAYCQEENGSPTHAWHKEMNVQVVQGPEGPRVNFRFDVPSRLKTALVDPEDYEDLAWRLELYLPGQPAQAVYGFDVELEPAPDVGTREALAEDSAGEPVPEGLPAAFQGLAAIVGQEKVDSLSARDRAKFHEVANQLSPEQREQVARLVKAGPLIKKLLIAVVVLFIAVQVIGAIVVALGFTS